MSASRSVSAGPPPGIGNGAGLVSMQSATVTILAGTSLSNSLDCRNLGMLVAVLYPVAWTSARTSFLGSVDNSSFFSIFDSNANEPTVRQSSAAGLWLAISTSGTATDSITGLVGAPYLKIRSGVSTLAVNQVADRILTLIFHK